MYYGKTNFDNSVVFAYSLLFPLKDVIFDNASEKNAARAICFFISNLECMLFETVYRDF